MEERLQLSSTILTQQNNDLTQSKSWAQRQLIYSPWIRHKFWVIFQSLMIFQSTSC